MRKFTSRSLPLCLSISLQHGFPSFLISIFSCVLSQQGCGSVSKTSMMKESLVRENILKLFWKTLPSTWFYFGFVCSKLVYSCSKKGLKAMCLKMIIQSCLHPAVFKTYSKNAETGEMVMECHPKRWY